MKSTSDTLPPKEHIMPGSSNEPEEFGQRLALLEQVYPGPRTEAFYKPIEAAGIPIERPAKLLKQDWDERETLDAALGNWVADGSYSNVFKALEDLFVDYDYGLHYPNDPPHRKLDANLRKRFPFAKIVSDVEDVLMNSAPREIAIFHSRIIADRTAERDIGVSWTDLHLLHKGRFKVVESPFFYLPLLFSFLATSAFA